MPPSGFEHERRPTDRGRCRLSDGWRARGGADTPDLTVTAAWAPQDAEGRAFSVGGRGCDQSSGLCAVDEHIGSFPGVFFGATDPEDDLRSLSHPPSLALCLLVFAALVGSALGSPPRASANHQKIASLGSPDTDPSLAGRDVIFGTEERGDSFRFTALRQGHARLLRRLPRPRYGRTNAVKFAASRSGVAYSRFEEKPGCNSCAQEFLAAELGFIKPTGRHRRLAYCRSRRGATACPYPRLIPPVDVADPNIEVSGTHAAFFGVGGIVVRRLTETRSTTAVLPLAGEIGLFRLAGPRIAIQEVTQEENRDPTLRPRSSLLVLNWKTRRPVYRVTLPRGAVLDGFDLQADGKLALSYDAGTVPNTFDRLKRVAWASPAEPYLHPVALPGKSVTDDTDLFFAGNRIAVTRGAGREGVPRRYQPLFLVSDLSGRVLKSFTLRRQGRMTDFDGRCLVWRQSHTRLHEDLYLARVDQHPPRSAACS